MSRKQIWLLIGILAAVAFLLFFRLGRQDMLGDDGHYAFRSIHYLDFLASLTQTTPVNWLGHTTWWSVLSFHDHPPLFFLIQHIFLKIFGLSVVVSRLPSALAALGTAAVLFFIGKRLGGMRLGFASLIALGLNNYFIWTGRIGLLESVFTVFLLLGIWHLLKGLEDDRKFLFAGLYFGLAFLSKYTLLFVLPGLMLYLLWQERQVFRRKRFWFGLLLGLVLTLPVVIYNLQMYHLRGHFDVQFADLFHQSHADWTNLQQRVSLKSFDPLGMFNILGNGFSWPYLAVFGLAFLENLYVLFRKQADRRRWLPVLVFVFLFLFFSLVGAASRWLEVLAPFAALIIGFSWMDLVKSALYRKNLARYFFQGTAGVLGVFCLFYILNTNIFYKPIRNPYLVSALRVENYGYNQLDNVMTRLLAQKKGTDSIRDKVRQWWYKPFDPSFFESLQDPGDTQTLPAIIIYDSNTDWFPTLWTFEKWKLFHGILIFTSEEFLKVARSTDVKILDSLDLKEIYFIRSGPAVAAHAAVKFPESGYILNDFLKNKVEPQIIYDDQGREAFYIYHAGHLN